MSIISIIYNLILIPVLSVFINVYKLFNKKLKEREGMWEDVLEQFNLEKKHNKRIWVHSASMGEFEQVKPIIERIKKIDSSIQVVISFFSPSGYNNQKDYQYADSVLYLPFDKRSNAKYFLDKVEPDIAVFVRYEIWRNHLEILRKKSIKSVLVCATKPGNKSLYSNQLLKSFTKTNYELFSRIFTISNNDTEFFINELQIQTQVSTSSDTRFDRIMEKVNEANASPILKKELLKQDAFVLVCGSTWEEDEKIIIGACNKILREGNQSLKLIIVPHEPTEKHLKTTKTLLPNSFFLSEIEEQILDTNSEISEFLGSNHIIVDSIGKLLKLYGNADAAYVGGAFGSGVHSVTEPAGYGIPLATGPDMANSPDAVNLKEIKGLNVVENEESLYSWLKMIIESKEDYNRISEINKKYIIDSLGESDRISKFLLKEINPGK